jgi:hypothetical protein
MTDKTAFTEYTEEVIHQNYLQVLKQQQRHLSEKGIFSCAIPPEINHFILFHGKLFKATDNDDIIMIIIVIIIEFSFYLFTCKFNSSKASYKL